MHREEGGEKGCVHPELKGSTLGCYQSCWCAAWAGGPRAVLEIPPEINCSWAQHMGKKEKVCSLSFFLWSSPILKSELEQRDNCINFLLISLGKFANVSAFFFFSYFFLAFFINLCRNSFFPTATLLRVRVWSVVLSKIMANYSVKNFLFWGLFPPLLSIVSQGEISSSFDFTPSQPSFHQDMPWNLKGAVSAKRSL